MHKKYLVLLFLTTALGATVYGMIQLENRFIFAETPPATRVVPVDNRAWVSQLDEDEWQQKIENAKIVSLAKGDYLSVRIRSKSKDLATTSDSLKKIFLKGVNMGVALPGCFPSEFKATATDYYQWFDDIGKMNSNAIRVYTILPPEFYAAFSQYNFDHPEHPLWLLQGIWAEIPDDGDFLSDFFLGDFQNEIRDAVDVIFGHANLAPRAGHASGKYVIDVSRHTFGFILGREWEPFAVEKMNAIHPELRNFVGRFFGVPDGKPMECFLAKVMDYALSYETESYDFQHPISFVNWLPLDPLFHDSEWIESEMVREYDNDLITLDPMHIYPTPSAKAGYFASYHAYPYYPDFVGNDLKYRNHKCEKGNCAYSGYLQELRDHHRGMPVIIAEYGIPTSRSSSHFTPSGMNQGGHSEIQQGIIDAHLSEDIFQNRYNGAIIFSWIDEWFKHNWLVMDTELPAERNKLWHNLEDPEQNFGIAAIEDRRILIDGREDDWPSIPQAEDAIGDISPELPTYYDIQAVDITSDATCLYLKLHLNGKTGHEIDWSHLGIMVAIDTYDAEKGDHLMPYISQKLGRGAEFLLDIRGPGHTRLLIDNPYDIYTDFYHDSIPTYRSLPNSDGIFNRLRLLANRSRLTLTGEYIPPVILYRGDLIWGRADSVISSQADICASSSSSMIEMRIPWALLNVTDPSSRAVLDNDPLTPEFDITATDGFQFYLVSYDPSGTVRGAIDKFPDNFEGNGLRYSWAQWEQPEFKYRLKSSYPIIAESFARFDHIDTEKNKMKQNRNEVAPSARITDWPGGKDGAATVTFDDGSYGQYHHSAPILEKYELGATFFVVTSWTGDDPITTGEQEGLYTRRLSWPQIRDLAQKGFEIGSHGHEHKPLFGNVNSNWAASTFGESRKMIKSHIGSPCVSVSFPYSVVSENTEAILKEIGFQFGRRGGDRPNPLNPDNFLQLYSYAIIDSLRPGCRQFNDILSQNKGKWTIVMFHHTFPEEAREWGIYSRFGIKDSYSLRPRNQECYLRLLRNSGFAFGSMKDIGNYIKLRQSTRLKFDAMENAYFISLSSAPQTITNSIPLSIELTTPWEFIEISGSQSDGIYEVRNGSVIFDARSGSEIIVRNLKILDLNNTKL